MTVSGRERIGGSSDDIDYMTITDEDGRVILNTLEGIDVTEDIEEDETKE